MDKPEYDLRSTYKKEKDPRIVRRMLAVHMVCECNDGVQETADRLMQCSDWVSMWVQRYREGGIDALRDLPRTGRKPGVPRKTMEDIIKTASESRTTPGHAPADHTSQHRYRIPHNLRAQADAQVRPYPQSIAVSPHQPRNR